MLTTHDYLRAAKQRFTTAEFLLDHDYTLDALYLAGYSVECSLKALILQRTPETNQIPTFERISSGSHWHKAEHLKAELKSNHVEMPLELVKRLRRFEWDTSLRYESGRRNRGEVRGYLKTAKAVIDWVEEQMQ